MACSEQFVTELQRAWDDGDAVLPVDVRLPLHAQADLVERMGAAVVVDAAGGRTTLPAHLAGTASGGSGAVPRPVEDGDALVVATSGSTGSPKGVVLTHGAVMASARASGGALGLRADDHWLACLPVAHIGGLAVVTRALHSKAGLTAVPRFGVEEVRAALQAGATRTSLVTAALRRLDQLDADRFRTILLGGAAPPSRDQLGGNVVATYGSTETGSGIVYDGTPLPGVELREVEGELLVRSPTLLRCYRDGSDPKDRDGWYPTGDAGRVLPDGSVQVHGRIAEMITTGGEKVWPAQVEAALRSHPSVGEALVHGAADPEWGMRVVARIELVPGALAPSLVEVREWVKRSLPAYAAPKDVVVVASLPRTPSGKVVRPQRTDAAP